MILVSREYRIPNYFFFRLMYSGAFKAILTFSICLFISSSAFSQEPEIDVNVQYEVKRRILKRLAYINTVTAFENSSEFDEPVLKTKNWNAIAGLGMGYLASSNYSKQLPHITYRKIGKATFDEIPYQIYEASFQSDHWTIKSLQDHNEEIIHDFIKLDTALAVFALSDSNEIIILSPLVPGEENKFRSVYALPVREDSVGLELESSGRKRIYWNSIEIYLQQMLMNNKFVYQFHKKYEKGGLNNVDEVAIENVLPDYDETLSTSDFIKYGCCWESEDRVRDLKARLPERTEFRKRFIDGAQVVFAENRRHGKRIEYYKLFIKESRYLSRVEDKQFAGNDEFRPPYGHRYSLNFRPGQLMPGFLPRVKGTPPPPPPPPPLPKNGQIPGYFLSACTKSTSFDTVYNHYEIPYRRVRDADHYLLAFDRETNEVYFLSGKDIYLTNSIPLYAGAVRNEEGTFELNHQQTAYSELEKNRWILYMYLQDRLYRYLVERLSNEHVIYEDEEKLVLRCKGKEYDEPVDIEVVYHFADPENVDIRILE